MTGGETMRGLAAAAVERIVRDALAEDIGPGDLTTLAVMTGEERSRAEAVAKSDLILAGAGVFRTAFHCLDSTLDVRLHREDGNAVRRGEVMAEVEGATEGILTAERVALNLLQRMCGIATTTARFVTAVRGTGARILDTRKTAPGLRILDKYAVRVGGGCNHRFALYDGVLVKDNHIFAAGGIAAAVGRVRSRIPHLAKVEVEVKTLDELREALAAGADVVMLDNMDLRTMRDAVAIAGRRIPLEASGNVTLDNVREIAETGVDLISVGALTHSVAAADISLRFV